MASSDDVINGESHSKLQMAPVLKGFAKFAKLNWFLESAWNSASDDRATWLLKKSVHQGSAYCVTTSVSTTVEAFSATGVLVIPGLVCWVRLIETTGRFDHANGFLQRCYISQSNVVINKYSYEVATQLLVVSRMTWPDEIYLVRMDCIVIAFLPQDGLRLQFYVVEL